MGSKEIKKICSTISTNALRWKLASKEGKIILDSISERLYTNRDDEEDQEEGGMKNDKRHKFDEETQKKTESLSDLIQKMEEIIKEVEAVEDKSLGLSELCDMSSSFTSANKSTANTSVLSSSSSQKSHNSSLISLDSSVVYTRDLVSWAGTVRECLCAQLRMNQCVARSICHVSSRDEAMFLTSVWAAQPGLTMEHEAAMVAVETTLKQCSSPT